MKVGTIWEIHTSLGPVSFHILKDFNLPRRIWLLSSEIRDGADGADDGEKKEDNYSIEITELDKLNRLYQWDSLYIKYCEEIDKIFLEVELSTDYQKFYGYPEYLLTPTRIPN